MIVFENIVNKIILESQESESIKQAKNLVVQRMNISPEKADEFVRINIRETLPILRTKKGGKFILGATRIILNNELNNASDIAKFNRILDIIINGHYDEYDRNLNNLSKQDLFNKFSAEDKSLSNAEKDEVNNLSYSNANDYQIVKIDSFEEATKYNQYVYKKDQWCITYSKENYNTYTGGGNNQIYFCLKNGFENIKPIKGENCPLDEYGLSMISVIVDDEGNLLYSTTRWNHSNGGTDTILSPKQISQIVNVNFFETFKPNENFKKIVDEIKNRLSRNESVKDIVDSIRAIGDNVFRISVGDRDNVVYKNKILSNIWFDGIEYFNDLTNMVKVYIGSKENLLSLNGHFVCPNTEDYSKWYSKIDEDDNNIGIVYVKYKNKYNFYNNGKLTLPFFVDELEYFFRGLAKISKDKQYNYCKPNGEILCKEMWFDDVNDFIIGDKTFVHKNGKINQIDMDGNLLYPNSTNTEEWANSVPELMKRYEKNESINFSNIVKKIIKE